MRIPKSECIKGLLWVIVFLLLVFISGAVVEFCFQPVSAILGRDCPEAKVFICLLIGVAFGGIFGYWLEGVRAKRYCDKYIKGGR